MEMILIFREIVYFYQNEKMGIQQQIVAELRELLPKGQLVEELQELFEVSRASVYKRLSGEILLNSKEIDKIIEKYPVRMAQSSNRPGNQVSLYLPPKPTEGDPIINYLSPIRDQLQELIQCDEAKITFLAVSFPVFYTFLYPEISLFKFYVYKILKQEMY